MSSKDTMFKFPLLKIPNEYVEFASKIDEKLRDVVKIRTLGEVEDDDEVGILISYVLKKPDKYTTLDIVNGSIILTFTLSYGDFITITINTIDMFDDVEVKAKDNFIAFNPNAVSGKVSYSMTNIGYVTFIGFEFKTVKIVEDNVLKMKKICRIVLD